MEIKRNFYMDKLINRKHNGLIKVITGIRRCGKSYLLNTLFYHHLLESGVPKDHIIRFAFDSAEDLHLIGENLIALEKKNKKANPEKLKNTFHTVKKSRITSNPHIPCRMLTNRNRKSDPSEKLMIPSKK